MAANKKKRKVIPEWFNQWAPPFIGYEPTKTYKERKTVLSTQIWDGDDLVLKPDGKYFIETIRGYDGDADELYLVEYTEEEKVNTHYKTQMKNWELANQRAEEWKEIKANIAEYNKEDQEREERATYLRLKKKYGDK